LQLSNIGSRIRGRPLSATPLERDEAAPEPSEASERRSTARPRRPSATATATGRLEAPAAAAPAYEHDENGTGDTLNGHGSDPHASEARGWASLRPGTQNGHAAESPNLEEFVAAGRSLADHLSEQLHLVVKDPAERLVGVHLIHMVDEAGYLR
jgi:RNA polymerase sigma-54 factor